MKLSELVNNNMAETLKERSQHNRQVRLKYKSLLGELYLEYISKKKQKSKR